SKGRRRSRTRLPGKHRRNLDAQNSGPGVARVSLDRVARLFASGCFLAGKCGSDGAGSKHHSGNDRGEVVAGSSRGCGHLLRRPVSADYRTIAGAEKGSEMRLGVTRFQQGYSLRVVAALVPSAEFEDQALAAASASTTDAQRQAKVGRYSLDGSAK